MPKKEKKKEGKTLSRAQAGSGAVWDPKYQGWTIRLQMPWGSQRGFRKLGGGSLMAN